MNVIPRLLAGTNPVGFVNSHWRIGLNSFHTATYILSGIEAMHMIKKKQVHQGVKSAQNPKEFIHKLFGLAS